MAKGDGRVTAKEMRRSCSGATQGPLRARRQGGAGVGWGRGRGLGLHAPLPSYWMRRVSAPASCLFWAKCTRLLQSGVSAPVKRSGVRNWSRYGQRTWGRCRGWSQDRGWHRGAASRSPHPRHEVLGRSSQLSRRWPQGQQGQVRHRAGAGRVLTSLILSTVVLTR